MNFDDYGTLRIRTTSASGAIPISGAIARIIGGEEFNRSIVKSLITDNDGITPKAKLPTPRRSYALTPKDEESPFALYDVEITAEGYFTKKIIGVAIFAGINAILPVNMIPESESQTENYPKGNVNSIIEN